MIKELKDVIEKINIKKNIIAKERDELWNLQEELSNLLDSFDRGIEGLENGAIEIEDAIDSISEVV